MRWSLILSLVSALISLSALDGVLALPAPVKSSELKQSSATYRKTAAKNDMYSLSKKAGIVKKVKTSSKVASTFHADHILEAQSLAKAIDNSGHTKASLGLAKWDKIKGILNSQNNLVMTPGDINEAKGRICRAGINGCTPNPADVKLAKDYIKKTEAKAKDTAAKLDAILGGTAVMDQHKTMKAAAGVKRELLLRKRYSYEDDEY